MLLIQVIRYVLRKFSSREVSYRLSEASASNEQILGVRHLGPKVTIIIPTRDRVDLLRACIESVREKTLYRNYEILVVDNDSVKTETHKYLEGLQRFDAACIRFPGKFNFAAISNFAANNSTGEILCFLNNDAVIADSDWLDYLVQKVLEPGTGVVGPVLLESDGVLSDCGLALGHKGIAGRILHGGCLNSAQTVEYLSQDHPVSAVSFACAVISRQTYLNLGGMDERFAVGLNDVDFGITACLQGLSNYVVSSSRVFHSGYGSRKKMFRLSGGLRALKEVLSFLSKHPGFNFRDNFVLRS